MRNAACRPKWRRGLRAFLASSTLAALTMGGTVMVATPAIAAQPSGACSSLNLFIGVRGTSAPGGSVPNSSGNAWQVGGMGDQVQGIANHFKNDYPYNSGEFPTYVESLNYPASVDLGNSIAAGVAKLRAELNYLASCQLTPNIILVGHSQGAAVIDGVLKNPGNLSAKAKQQIKGVALLGDPGHAANMPYSVMNTGNNGTLFLTSTEYKAINNTFRYWGWGQGSQNPNPTWVPRVRDYCFSGDAACTGNLTDRGWYTHTLYPTIHSQVKSWLDYMLTNTN